MISETKFVNSYGDVWQR